MSATEQIRAILDDLMGTARDGSSSNHGSNFNAATNQHAQPSLLGNNANSRRYRERGMGGDESNNSRNGNKDYDRYDRNNPRERDRLDRMRPDRQDHDRPRERERGRDWQRNSSRERSFRERDRSRSSGRHHEPHASRSYRDHSRSYDNRSMRELEGSRVDNRNGRTKSRLQEREILYQRKLKELEKREADRERKHAIRMEEEHSRKLLEAQESKKLKEFLEDYNDDRDDARFYRGSALARRLDDRRQEIKIDEASRSKEQMGLKILSNEYTASVSQPSSSNTNNNVISSNNNNIIHNSIHNNSIENTNIDNSNIDNSNTESNNNNHANNISENNSQRNEQIKNLIATIPTTKEDLFACDLDWSLLDENLLENRIRPWVSKKIARFFGDMSDKEIELINWICKSLDTHTDGESILKQVTIVLDNDAEKFVIQMWRLLIFELEAKKLGIVSRQK